MTGTFHLFPGSGVLWPLAWVYRAVTRLRNRLYDTGILASTRVPLPVVGVGNLTVGGSGKTPFCVFLAQRLLESGRSPVILLRGYRGKLSGPHLVSARDTVNEVGDEALMYLALFQGHIPVVIAKRRVNGAQFIVERQLGDVIVLDDGFQHRALRRNIDIVLYEGPRLEALAGERLLPVGRLREDAKEAIERADLIILVRRVSSREEKEKRETSFAGKRVLNFFLLPKSFVDVYSNEEYPLYTFAGKSGRALTGISRPEQFFSLLAATGICCEKTFAFPDHHLFSRREWENICRDFDGAIFTTEKDQMKLRPFLSKPGKLFSLRLQGEFLSKEEEDEFFELILGKKNLSLSFNHLIALVRV